MNKRIKKFAKEVFGASIDYEPFLATDVEKFAEAIVKECAKVGDSGDPLQDGEIARMIKQHFGIEE